MLLDRASRALATCRKAMNCTFIYGLSDPRTNQIRYIGKADDPKRRFQAHVSPETCAKLSAMRMGNQNTLGRKAPPETLERQRQAQIRRWEKWRIANGVPLDEKERNASRHRQYYAKHKDDPDFKEQRNRYSRELYARRWGKL